LEKLFFIRGDFRGHGRKGICLDRIHQWCHERCRYTFNRRNAVGAADEEVLTEQELEEQIVKKAKGFAGPVLFQSSSQT